MIVPASLTTFDLLPVMLGGLVFGFWGQLIGLAAGGIGSLLGSKSAKAMPPTPEEKEGIRQQGAWDTALMKNYNTGRDYATGVMPYGDRGYKNAFRVFDKTEDTYSPVANYYNTLLSGNRNAVSTLLGPEIARIRDRDRNLVQSARELNPRGGGSVSQATEQPFLTAREIGESYAGARDKGATGMFNLGGAYNTLGANQAQTGANAWNAAGNFLNTSNQAGSTGAANTGTLLNYNTNARRQALAEQQNQFGVGSSIGSGLFNVLKGVNWGGVFKKGAGGGGGSGGNSPFASYGG